MEKIAFINPNKTNEQIVDQSNRIDKLQSNKKSRPGENIFSPRRETASKRARVVNQNVNNHFTMGRGRDSVKRDQEGPFSRRAGRDAKVTGPHNKLTNEYVKKNINKDMSIATKGPLGGMALHRQEMKDNNDKGGV